MRILHVIAHLDPASGGPATAASRIAAAQAAAGNQATVAHLTPPPERRTAVSASLSNVPGWSAVEWVELDAGGWFGMTSGAAKRAIESQVSTNDVVHLHGVWDPILRTAAAAAYTAGVPYAVCLHGMLDPWSLAQKKLKKKVALQLGYRRMLNRAAFIHTLNRAEADLIEPLALTAPTEVVPNGVFPEEFVSLPPEGRFRETVRGLGDAKFVLFLGRLHFKKGLDVLAEAFRLLSASLPEVHLVVAGPDDGVLADFENRIGRSGVSDRVHVVGPLYGQTKYEAMVDSACFCLPSRQEGFSLAITEALACGRPVVISEACHFPEVSEVGAGVEVSLSSEAVALGLQHVLANAARAAEMGERGRTLVLDRFTWQEVVSRLDVAYARHVS